MTKRRTIPSSGPESSNAQPGDDHPSASPDHQTEAEETAQREVDNSSTQEAREASDALMESYNG